MSVGLKDVRLIGGLWRERFEAVRSGSLPAMTELMQGTENTQFLHNFKVASGTVEGRHRGPDWNDGDCYKWLEAVAAVYAATGDAALDKSMDDAIAVIAKAQRADGYLHTPVLISARNGDADAKPLNEPLQFELYNLGHLMTAGCVHHRATGKRSLLDVARRVGDYLVHVRSSTSEMLARTAICPAHYMGLVELSRTTNEKKYTELAAWLLDARGQVVGGTDDNQDRIPFHEQTTAVGHAVRANYLYAGAADIFAETGDATLLAPLEAIWSDMTTRKLYVTGACGALFDGASPDGSSKQKTIGRVHQAFGRAYQLPHSTAHNETCASIGFVLWNRRMLNITGNAKYADEVERSLFNAVLAGISLDGRSYFYTNTLRQLNEMPTELRWSRQRQPFISCFCCPPNVVRTIAEFGEAIYGRNRDELYVHQFASSELETELAPGRIVKLRQTTSYPWDGKIRLEILSASPPTTSRTEANEWTLNIRIPGWAKQARLDVNGSQVEQTLTTGRYASLRRPWIKGDVVELSLPMPIRVLEAHPLVEEARNQVAVQRGPLVYCLESSDLPAGTKLLDVALPIDGKLTPRFDAEMLGGVVVLEGRAILRSFRNPDDPASKSLYRDALTEPGHPFDVRLVPYFAWGNRGPSEMSVWLPAERSSEDAGRR